MYCPRCGLHNEDSDRFCSSCGQNLTAYRQLRADMDARRPDPPHQPTATQPPTPGEWSTPGEPFPERHAGAQPTGSSPRVPSYLGWAAAILTCCWPAWPAGVTALVFASRTESRLAAGDLTEAQEYSRKARTWCWVTLIAGLVLWAVILSVLISIS